MKEWVVDLFTDVPNMDCQQNRWEEAPLRREDLLTQCSVKLKMDYSWLDVELSLPDETFLFDCQSSRYISHLIGHRGPGIIYSNLRSKGWVTEIYTSLDPVCPGSPGIFIFRMLLTKNGLKHYLEIVKEFFGYASLLRESSPQEWIFNELKRLADLAFQFQQKIPASDLTREISAVMQMPVPREWLLSKNR
jgi:insulysin